MKIVDTHAHLDLEPFHNDFEPLRQRLETGRFPDGFQPKSLENLPLALQAVVLPGIDADSSCRCVELSRRSPIFFAAIGIQPNSLAELQDGDWERILAIADAPKVVGIGETGLDRYWDTSSIDTQIDYFHRHIALAKKIGKPILIHCRDAWEDMLPILRRECSTANGGLTGLIHAFSGEPEQALECVELGLSISFAGALTYTNRKFEPLWRAAQALPEDRILVETDSPYMVPHPFRGKLERNEPTLAASVAVRLAELRGVSVERIAEATTKNACRLFRFDEYLVE